MDREKQYFIQLLRAFANDALPPSAPDGLDWRTLIKLSEEQSLGGIVGYAAGQLKGDAAPDNDIKKQLRDMFLFTLKTFTQKKFAADVLMNHFEEAGIPRIYFKGYIVRDYYPIPELRSFCDIDFVVRDEDVERTETLMNSLGYTAGSRENDVYCYKKPGEYYEIHTTILQNELNNNAEYCKYFRNMWDNTVSLGGHAYKFRDEYHLIYLLVHLGKHLAYVGAGVRMFLDVALYLKGCGQFDWDFFWEELDKLSLRTFACRVLYMCKVWFDTEIPEAVPPMGDTDVKRFADHVLGSGTFGSYRDKVNNQIRFSMKNENDNSGKFRLVMQTLFPPYASMRKTHPFVDGKPYLLPVGWAVRGLGFFSPKKRRSVGKMMNQISETDDDIKAQYRFFEMLGLSDKYNK